MQDLPAHKHASLCTRWMDTFKCVFLIVSVPIVVDNIFHKNNYAKDTTELVLSGLIKLALKRGGKGYILFKNNDDNRINVIRIQLYMRNPYPLCCKFCCKLQYHFSSTESDESSI